MMRFINSLLSAIGLSSGFTAQQTIASASQREAEDQADRQEYEARINAVVNGLVLRSTIRVDNTLDILMLSGGGQHGAYGIGFLRGWQSRADAIMPNFDLVTGISTGGLQAPFALLGTAAALDQASALYRSATTDFAPTFDWLFWLRRTGGLVKTARYKLMIEREMDTRMTAQLQASFSEGKQLVIGTTDFNLGIGRLWDIGHELQADDGLNRVQQILLATTAIPGVFPPLIIDGHVHADGGVISNLLGALDFEGYRKLGARLAASGVTQPTTVRIWVVVNMWTYPKPISINPFSRRAILQRSNSLMFWNHQLLYLAGLNDLIRAVNAEVPELRLEMRYTAIPSELANAPGAAALFNEEWMTRIEKFGFERAQGANPWDTTTTPHARPLPVLTSAERVAFDQDE
ncbi:patatin-like phospholipase family protein [Glaciimonas sp. PCH181]|uniref:patatin-like phospholipase family protein n=1 Tax=Glaciimonas sp. PCH181 TaxID=2133943 RepID=UPI000D3DC237|nr:patatin-like phospholipase family protein [Glaciimonas sp. PCH181]PUA19081.1 hypothetical protein C7W93_04065 [Glaciimonas sp. PCH181]